MCHLIAYDTLSIKELVSATKEGLLFIEENNKKFYKQPKKAIYNQNIQTSELKKKRKTETRYSQIYKSKGEILCKRQQ